MTEGSRAPRQLPARPLFVNRDGELGRFAQWQRDAAASGRPMLAVVQGAEGVGKTTFGIVACHRAAETYPDAQLYYDLRGSDPQASATATQVAAHFLRELGVPREDLPDDDGELIGKLRSELAGKRVLMLLDDARTVEQVEPLLFDSERAAVVVTTRRSLAGLRRRHHVEFLELTSFTDAAAGELITRIAGPERDDLGEHLVHTLNVLCEGLPLALSLVAINLADLDVPAADYVERLLAGYLLHELDVDGDRLVAKVFDAVYHDLDEREARAYRLLAVVPGPHVDLRTAAEVLGLAETGAERLLRGLTRKYVLERMGTGRFRFHNLVREHAAERARAELPEPEIEAATAAAVRARWQRAVALDKSCSGRPVPVPAEADYEAIPAAFTGAVDKAFAEFELDWPNLIASAAAARELPAEPLAAAFPVALWFFGYQTHRQADLIDAYRHALGHARDDRHRWQLLRDLAALHDRLGEWALVDDAIARARLLDHPPGLASLSEWHGLSMENRGDLPAALAEFDRAWQAVPLMGDDRQEQRARALLRMHTGRVRLRLGEPGAADGLLAAYEYFAGHERERVNRALSALWLGSALRGQDAERARPYLLEAHAALTELKIKSKAAEAAAELAELPDLDPDR